MYAVIKNWFDFSERHSILQQVVSFVNGVIIQRKPATSFWNTSACEWLRSYTSRAAMTSRGNAYSVEVTSEVSSEGSKKQAVRGRRRRVAPARRRPSISRRRRDSPIPRFVKFLHLIQSRLPNCEQKLDIKTVSSHIMIFSGVAAASAPLQRPSSWLSKVR